MPKSEYKKSLAYFAFAYVVTLLAFVVTSFFPRARLWGLNWYTYFPDYVLWITAGIALLVLLALYRSIWPKDEGIGRASGCVPVYFISAGALIVVSGFAFYLFKCETHFLGDGYLLISKLEGTMELERPSQYGPLQLQQFIYSLFDKSTPDRGFLTFRLISWGSGLLFLTTVALVAYRLFESNRRRLLFLLGLATGGYALLFFGYAENYPPFVLAVGLFCLGGLLVTRGLLSRWAIIPLLIVAGVFHVFAVALVPAAIYLLLSGTQAGRWIGSLAWRWKVVAVAIMVAAGLAVIGYFYSTDYFFRFALVPPLADKFTVGGYTMFSGQHLLDYVNLLVMLLPAVVIIPFLPLWRDRSLMKGRSDLAFLILAVIPCLLIDFVVDPKLGMPRDWDLLSFAGVPLAFLLYYALLDERHAAKFSWKPAALSVALGLMLLVPRVASQHDIIVSIDVFDDVTSLDPLRTRAVQHVLFRMFEKAGDPQEARIREAEYLKQRPDLTWLDNAIEDARQGRTEEAVAGFRRVIAFNPSHSAAWSNLGGYFQRTGDNDSALICLKVADGLTPHDAHIQHNLGIVYYSMGDYDNAERHWKEAIKLDPDNFNSRELLLKLYQRENRSQDYLKLSFEMFEIGARQDAPLPFIQNIAELYLQKGDYVNAAANYRRALMKGLDTAVVRGLEQQYPQLHILDYDR